MLPSREAQHGKVWRKIANVSSFSLQVFGPPPSNHETSKLPQHGFARNTRWEYLGKTTSESSSTGAGGDSSVKLDFGLSDAMLDAKAKSAWDHKFNITYSITLSPGQLATSFLVRNTSEARWEFQVLFHTYFKVGVSRASAERVNQQEMIANLFVLQEISNVSITGLESTAFLDKVAGSGKLSAASNKAITFDGETDRVYSKTTEPSNTITQDGAPLFEVTRDGLDDVVVWNPWIEKAKGLGDFEPKEGYKNMVCLEAGSVIDWVRLDAGDTWEGGQTMKAAS